MATFSTEQISLTMKNPSTGENLKANVYTLDGITNPDGTKRHLSMGQLVLAICLNRAVGLENGIVAIMESIAANTEKIRQLTTLEEHLVSCGNSAGLKFSDIGYAQSELPPGWSLSSFWTEFVNAECGTSYVFPSVGGTQVPRSTIDEIITTVEQKLDSYNTTSQEQLIDLQSRTSKRDDTYNLAANILKSFNNVNLGIANNL